jgi:phage baseplate assembly protein W
MVKRLYNQKIVAGNKFVTVAQDTGSFTYRGFSSKSSSKKFKLYDIDLVKQDLINHFYIRKGEKLENPEFGTIIWDMIYEPFTEESKRLISKDVEDIVNYDPRVVVNEVEIDSTEFGMRIQINLTYVPFNINEKMTFDFDKSNGAII